MSAIVGTRRDAASREEGRRLTSATIEFVPPATSVPASLDATSWSALEPVFHELLDRPLRSRADFDAWMIDRSELDAACSEAQANLYIAMTCATEDAPAQRAYAEFIENIVPKIKPLAFALDKKLTAEAERLSLSDERYGVVIRDTAADIALFRTENIPLETELSKLSQKYDQIIGAMTVSFDGGEKTLPQMAVYQESIDRSVRESAWRSVAARRLQDKDGIDSLFDTMVEMRDRVARNAGFADFVGYVFKAKHRFDYTPRHCFDFHRACEDVVVPMIRRQEEKRRRSLGVDVLRPWDLTVDVKGRGPLRPFSNGTELMSKSVRTFNRLDPRLGSMLAELGSGSEARGSADGACLDLDSRKGKAPGGYQYVRDRSRKPFIFMNAAGTGRDVSTMLHEAGHAFHSVLSINEPLLAYRHAPLEFCEVASMSMELLTLPHIGGQDGFYSSEEDLARARRQQIERAVYLLPWIATVDAFQHWIYTNPRHSHEQRIEEWLRLDTRFGSSCSWEGIEETRRYIWHRQSHIFSVPFYYIEYAIAQLGALQLWLIGLERGEKAAIDLYIRAMTLGGSRPLPALFSAAGLRFDFGPETVRRLVDRAEAELDRLPE
ncbi:MAG: M3 family oligoendopeptidase [Phycisphaeraceae bacterium]|nr:M3 family oligoendopeptidase [Phycisphaeraceae bacterium]